jgi:hypothetical protein
MAKISTQEITELYKTLLEQESSNHNIFITVLLAIVVILLGATWWFNKNGATKMIKDEIDHVIQEEKNKLRTDFNKKLKKMVEKEVLGYENRMKSIEADVARSMAISAKNEGIFTYSIFWFTKYLEMNLELNNQESTQIALDWIIDEIESLEEVEENERKENPELTPDFVQAIHSSDYILEVIERVPDFLSKEKKIITDAVILRHDDDLEDEEI